MSLREKKADGCLERSRTEGNLHHWRACCVQTGLSSPLEALCLGFSRTDWSSLEAALLRRLSARQKDCTVCLANGTSAAHGLWNQLWP